MGGQSGPAQAAPPPGTVEAAQARDTAVLQRERARFPGAFAQAYAAYPAIPRGTLEAVAYAQSRWRSLRPAHDAGAGHHRMPPAWGVMGLYAGEGFADQVGEAAALLGTPAGRVRDDPATNVRAAALLLARELRGSDPDDVGALVGALARYAGFGAAPGRSAVDDHARTAFAFDVLLALDRGIDEDGIRVPARAIAWERAFPAEDLVRLRAPFVRLDVSADRIETEAYAVDPVDERLVRRSDAAGPDAGLQSTDYAPALWEPAHTGNYAASRTAAVGAVALHTAQGSYAGTISWFKNAAAGVSAHYVIRSADGQVTQMVRHAHTAWHVRSHNATTIGIEHEGYVDNPSWYTSAMYDASAALVRHLCAAYAAIDCASAYAGAASSGIQVLPDSVRIKGHQHFSGQTHTDPGIHWDWGRYHALLNPGAGAGTARVLDGFETGVGRFNTAPAYSGSTTGISAASTASRDCTVRRNGDCALRVLLRDDPGSSAAWSVRLLSGAGSPGSNAPLARANGRIGFWVHAGGSGMRVRVGIDDSDGTERSVARSVPADAWTFVEWSFADAAQWEAWAGGANGAITAQTVTLDAIWIERAQTRYDVNVRIDDVQIRN
ncbi:hypothetical protein WQ56_13820 [Luteimonas sp. FCS-9]|nr:hypothetical protein WQ56_13820 [Luteimonas sp. FCS-9]